MTDITDKLAEALEPLAELELDPEENEEEIFFSFTREEVDTAKATLAAYHQAKAQPSQVQVFAQAILHGDKEHQAWLLEAAQCFVDGKPMQSMKDVVGFGNAIAYISSLLERVGQDDGLMPFVTEVSGDLGELTNAVKQMEQEVLKAQEEMGQSGGMTPEAQAKILDAGIVAETKAKISEATAAQKMGQKEQQFQSNEARKDAQTAAEIQRKLILTKVDAVTTPKPEEPAAAAQ